MDFGKQNPGFYPSLLVTFCVFFIPITFREWLTIKRRWNDNFQVLGSGMVAPRINDDGRSL